MRALDPLRTALLAQRGQLLCWAPVCLAIGIGVYFALPVEPAPGMLAGVAAGAACLLLTVRWSGEAPAPLLLGLALILLGLALAGTRARMLEEPVLGWRYYGPVEGRIVEIDRSASDKPRLTLDRVVLGNVAPGRTPARVRVSLHGAQDWIVPEPGMTVILTAHLSPPSGPTEPGGFDFQRMAWFERLGAVGYSRTPALVLAPAAAGSAGLGIYRLRMSLSAAIREALPGERGTFAAAILTGDRSSIPQGTLEDLRAANLAHLLAISGLHMGLLTGLVFGAIRAGIALVPALALRVPGKKIAAGGALVAAAAYLALSGGNVATERAFVMVAVALVAVLLGRRALTLRAVAVAALIVLALRPEALTGPGFQMSFAATTALVAVFRGLRGWEGRVPRPLRGTVAVILSSAVAGAATAPIAAAHFNQMAHYGLIANLLSVPVMGLLVMPAALMAGGLWLLGAEQLGLRAMGWGLDWILGVAHRVADLDGAVGHVPTPGSGILPALALAGLWAVLWCGRARWLAVPAAALALGAWGGGGRPDMIVSDSGGLIGIMGPEGRVLSKPRGDGFVARVWLENDGAPVAQEVAAARPGWSHAGQKSRARLGPERVLQLRGERVVAATPDCDGATLLVLTVEDAGARPCRVIDAARLRQEGSHAVYLEPGGGLTIVTARDVTGARLWNTRALRRENAQ